MSFVSPIKVYPCPVCYESFQMSIVGSARVPSCMLRRWTSGRTLAAWGRPQSSILSISSWGSCMSGLTHLLRPHWRLHSSCIGLSVELASELSPVLCCASTWAVAAQAWVVVLMLHVYQYSTAISCPFAMVACHAPFGLLAGACLDRLSTTSFCKHPLVPRLTRVVRSLSPTGRRGGLASHLFEGVASSFFRSIVSATADFVTYVGSGCVGATW